MAAGSQGPFEQLHVPLQKTLYGANVIIFEGIMAFADQTLLEVRVGSRLIVLLRVLTQPNSLPHCGTHLKVASSRQAWQLALSRPVVLSLCGCGAAPLLGVG